MVTHLKVPVLALKLRGTGISLDEVPACAAGEGLINKKRSFESTHLIF